MERDGTFFWSPIGVNGHWNLASSDVVVSFDRKVPIVEMMFTRKVSSDPVSSPIRLRYVEDPPRLEAQLPAFRDPWVYVKAPVAK